ncbi:hypothetical protein [Novosphingobium arvoryzae]|uniref:Sugar transporter n=1 Tax=Novosphingobium arvoryzae TaxID=1256514 RepID=A0A918REA3_9SPHN|nr:hypothetical protein [Novosphingobium arvoryzae]GGZ92213.1 hypothetical protein GCM10011617_09580 [Novosphingobium arvoryzae]
MAGTFGAVRPPLSFWVVAGLSLLWNGFGAYLYTLTNLDDAALLASAPPAMQDYIANMPLWAHIAWALGIWGSLAGSVLLLLRVRHAVAAFGVSLLGAAGSFTAQGLAGVLEPAQPVLILAVIAFLLWYARSAVTAGNLR